MNGIDANELLSDKPEARVTQIQTLNDIVRDVEADEVYRSVTRTRLSVNNVWTLDDLLQTSNVYVV